MYTFLKVLAKHASNNQIIYWSLTATNLLPCYPDLYSNGFNNKSLSNFILFNLFGELTVLNIDYSYIFPFYFDYRFLY